MALPYNTYNRHAQCTHDVQAKPALSTIKTGEARVYDFEFFVAKPRVGA